jgi:hypothetical protein
MYYPCEIILKQMIQHQKYRHLVAVKTLQKVTYPSQLQMSFPPTLNYYSTKRLVAIISNHRIPSSDRRIRKPMKFKVKQHQYTKKLTEYRPFH